LLGKADRSGFAAQEHRRAGACLFG
jgi:hypothetical protein